MPVLLLRFAAPALGGDIELGMVDAQAIQGLTGSGAKAVWDRHFSVYAGAGVGTVRAQTGWSDQQFVDGTWRNATALPYMREALARGLHLSIDLETIAAPPAWFIDAHPDARLVDQNGLTTQYQTVSYWWPGLAAMIHAKTDTMLQMLAASGVLAGATSVGVSLGPADEPLYPPQWTIASPVAPGFWCYDVHAEADFVVKMAAKYGTIASANRAWGSRYASFAALVVPKPGSVPAAEWADVIAWYRNAKRAFIAWQVADTAAELAKWAPRGTPLLSVPVAGDHLSGSELQASLVDESSADASVVQMTDSEFVLDQAAINHASAHFTGMPDLQELEFIRAYMAGRGYDARGMQLSAENVGNVGAPTAAAAFTTEALAVDLDGFDYLYGSALFAADDVSAGPSLAAALAMESAIADGRDAPRAGLRLPTNFALAQNACVDISAASPTAAATRLCLSNAGRLIVTNGAAVLWQAASPGETCPVSAAWNLGCFALLQADGNFVLYNAATGYWNSGTSASGAAAATTLTLSVAKPYLTLRTSSGATVWDSSAGKHE